jgi:NAD(P)-dependent dehydrogenase (short-subunit alcohol dehydrogenase family)
MAAGMLAGKAALITGSTSGIGLAMARALAGAGANVALHGFGTPEAIQGLQDELKNNHGVQTTYSDADLRKPPLIRDMVKQVHDKFGRIDILVNNAGGLGCNRVLKWVSFHWQWFQGSSSSVVLWAAALRVLQLLLRLTQTQQWV